MLRFQHPDLLWLLLAVPLLAAGFVGLHLWNRNLLRRFIAPGLWPPLLADASVVKRGAKQLLLLLSVACLVMALANPQIGTRLEEVKREGIDLFVALDVSLSMKAEDVRPSRLEKAKRDVSQLLRKLAGDRVGLIVFAGDAFVQFPLTADYAAADLFISTVDVESVPTPGTMIGSAIDKALESFTKDQPTQKAIVIVSDGENTEGDVLGAVEKASTAGVKVYTVGMGTLEGGPIPIGGSDYKRDMSGNVVVSKLDESMLRQVATATGARYLRATSGGNEIDDVFKELSTLEKTEFGSKQVTGYESRYQVPLAFAILFLLLELLLSERRGAILQGLRRALRGGPISPAAILATLLTITAVPATAQSVRDHVKDGNKLFDKGKYADAEAAYRQALSKDPTSGVSHFNLGDAHFRQDRHEEAARAFSNSAMNLDAGPDRSTGYYNLGNALFKANKLDEAIEAYKRALRNDPDNDDARYNLEVARNKRQQQQQQQQQKQDQKKDQNQDKQQQQDQKQDQKQDQQQQDKQKQDQQQQNQQQQQDRTRQQQQKNQMNKEEAERMLEALRNNEKDIQKKLQKRPAARVRVEKDW